MIDTYPFDYIETETGIEDVARSSRIFVLLSQWRTSAAIDDGLPTLRAMNQHTVEGVAGNCVLLMPVDGGRDFCSVHYGRELARYSEDTTGGYSSAVPGRIGEFLHHQYRTTLSRGQPRLIVAPGLLASEVRTWERLIMPVSAGLNERLLLVYMTPVEMRQNLLRELFDKSAVGMFALRALRTGAGEISDFRFVTANEAYARITGQPLDRIVHELVGHLFPHYVSSGLVDIFAAVMRSGEDQTFEIVSTQCANPGTYRVSVSAISDGLAVTLVPLGPLPPPAALACDVDHPLNLTTPAFVD